MEECNATTEGRKEEGRGERGEVVRRESEGGKEEKGNCHCEMQHK